MAKRTIMMVKNDGKNGQKNLIHFQLKLKMNQVF